MKRLTSIRLTNNLVIFIIIGVIYVFMEVFFTSIISPETRDKYSFKPIPQKTFSKMAFQPFETADNPTPIKRWSTIGASSIWMFFLGGLCGLFLYAIHKIGRRRLNLFWQSLLGALIITILELIAGLILNGIFRFFIWDYTDDFLNFKGQICLMHSVIYFFPIAPVAYWFFHFLEAGT